MEPIVEELVGMDYIQTPLVGLVKHPDFNPEVLWMMTNLLGMTTAKLETLIKIMRKENSNG
jgi:hypothetical protein